jgi:hypothetical protein
VLRVGNLVPGVEHQHEIVVAQRAEPYTKPLLHLRGRLLDVAGADRRARRDDRLQPAERPFAVGGDGFCQQLPLALEGDDVGAVGRHEGGDHDADDGNGDDNAERHQHAEACLSPAGIRSLSCAVRLRRFRHYLALRPS